MRFRLYILALLGCIALGCHSEKRMFHKIHSNLYGEWNFSKAYYFDCESNTDTLSIAVPSGNRLKFGNNNMMYSIDSDSTSFEIGRFMILEPVNESHIVPIRINYDIINEGGGLYDTLYIESITKGSLQYFQVTRDTCFRIYLTRNY